ncbi:MAG: pseudouridine-5'-phosphate glycosidase, partial [Thermaceae bacterium]
MRAQVALETALLTHGFPPPLNLSVMEALLQAVEEEGAVPRAIGVVGGKVRVGLSREEIRLLAEGKAEKASLWNLASLIAQGKDAGTTVAATILLAHRAGLQVLATGGIGGVHYAPFDESADLLALSRAPLLVVSSGPKSVLDLEATLERLETYGI